MNLSNRNLADQLRRLAGDATALADRVAGGVEGLEALDLAGGMVEAARLREKLTKLGAKVGGGTDGNGRGRRRR